MILLFVHASAAHDGQWPLPLQAVALNPDGQAVVEHPPVGCYAYYAVDVPFEVCSTEGLSAFIHPSSRSYLTIRKEPEMTSVLPGMYSERHVEIVPNADHCYLHCYAHTKTAVWSFFLVPSEGRERFQCRLSDEVQMSLVFGADARGVSRSVGGYWSARLNSGVVGSPELLMIYGENDCPGRYPVRLP